MGSVITVACNVSCGHVVPPKMGLVATTGAPKLMVAGSPALLETGIDGQAISTCGLVASGPPPTVLCTAVIKITGTLATKLFVSGSPVVIAPLTGTTNGTVAGTTPQPLLQALLSQSLLTTT